MNINFKINKEEENVIVSNQEGTMDEREYQDNIEDILKLEDVIEKQETDLYQLNKKKKEKELQLKDKEHEIKKANRTYEIRKKWFLGMLVGVPIFMVFASLISEIITCTGPEVTIGLQHIINGLVMGGIGNAMVIVASILYVISEDFPLNHIKQIRRHKEEIKLTLKDLELEIFLLEQTLNDNKNQLQYMLDQKEKKNIQNVSEEIQRVAYQEDLELQRCYLIEMYELNKTKNVQNQSPKEPKASILGRFRKKKQY